MRTRHTLRAATATAGALLVLAMPTGVARAETMPVFEYSTEPEGGDYWDFDNPHGNDCYNVRADGYTYNGTAHEAQLYSGPYCTGDLVGVLRPGWDDPDYYFDSVWLTP
ncbi:hypothetical protein ACIGXM_10810 [Kitasatospora sp. NPDC052896]|uniref:hypothetical protein n=1 Tax=Kitasatospora sp. NPDC052896 TaxID=3364061 RepID=UPI0037C6A1DE